MRQKGLQSGNVYTEREVSVANLDWAVWVRLAELDIILLDNRLAVDFALHDRRCERE